MKTFIKIFSISAALLIFNFAASHAALKNVNHHFLQSENREVHNFHAIASSGSFNVMVKMGKEESLKIEGDDEDLQRVETIVQNGTLKIRMKRDVKNWNTSSSHKVTIYITAKKLDGLILSGSGNLSVNGVLNSASADIQLSGSGEISAQLDTQNAGIALSGSGNVVLSGTTGNMNVSISGSGSVKATDLVCDSGKLNIAGSGNVYVHAKENLEANIIGSGSIKYVGEPSLSVNKVGSGSVSKMK